MLSINVEHDVRRQYNRRILFCIRIRGAALIIGLWDLFIHSTALFALILTFSKLPQAAKDIDAVTTPANPIDSFESSASLLLNNDNDRNPFPGNSLLLSKIIEKRNTTLPTPYIDVGHFYTNLDLITLKWIRSLRDQDRYIAFVLVGSVTLFILVYLWGILTNKPAYIVPYFLIKVFNVLISIFSMLGLYSSPSNVRLWLRTQPDFPMKSVLLELDNQTIQLIIFVILLFIVLAKLYIAAIVWYCYGYITALNMARAIGIVTSNFEPPPRVIGDMYSPPKYEEAIQSQRQQLQQHRQEDEEEQLSPPPYTPLLSSTM